MRLAFGARSTHSPQATSLPAAATTDRTTSAQGVTLVYHADRQTCTWNDVTLGQNTAISRTLGTEKASPRVIYLILSALLAPPEEVCPVEGWIAAKVLYSGIIKGLSYQGGTRFLKPKQLNAINAQLQALNPPWLVEVGTDNQGQTQLRLTPARSPSQGAGDRSAATASPL